MKIGIDLDGVIYDSEKDFRVYQELYDMYVLKKNTKIDEKEIRIQKRFGWSDEIFMDFLDRYYAPIVKETNYMPGAKMVLKMLKEEGHELIIITARGVLNENDNIEQLTKERLSKDNFEIFDKYCFGAQDKAEVCKNEKIDVMIDDSNLNCKNTSENQIKTIYLKDAPSYDMEENEYLKVLYNWGEIYRYLKEIEN